MLDWVISPILGLVKWIWGKLLAPRLRLDFLADPACSSRAGAVRGDRGQNLFPIVKNGDMWQVVFGLAMRNEGRLEARNWRVRFVTSEATTMMHLDKRPDDRRSVTETPIGSGWQHEVQAGGPSDTVPPRMPVYIHGRHTLNFGGNPDAVVVRCWLTAEGIATREVTLRVEPDWGKMTALFRWQ